MIINYTLTFADYREMQTAMGFSRRWLRYGLLAWIGLMLPALVVSELSASGRDPSAPSTMLSFVLGMLPLGLLLAGWISVIIMTRRQAARCIDISDATRWVLTGIGVAGLIAGLVLLVIALDHLSESFWIWIGLIIAISVIFCGVLVGRLQRKIWDALADQHRPKQLELANGGIILADGVTRFEYAWDAFLSSRDTKTVFVLVINRYSALIVPRRAFPDAQAATTFAAALKQNIVPRTGGFPIRPCPPPVTSSTDLPVARLTAQDGVQR